MPPSLWTPRLPLTLAEAQVDFPAHRYHIDHRRQQVERAAAPLAKRLAFAQVDLNGLPPQALADRLQAELARQLDTTATFGYRQARAEIISLRAAPVRAGYVFPDAGKHAATARQGLPAVKQAIRQRSHEAVNAVLNAVAAAVQKNAAKTRLDLILLAQMAALRMLHNAVLEMVGETLNLGRTAGAYDAPGGPPEYAMRSEQLDENTCDDCQQLHGEIVQLDSPDYDDLMPPNGCQGGGRCRGVYVYGDTYGQVEMPEAA